jgi:uncharacterized protein (TIGR02145 family)
MPDNPLTGKRFFQVLLISLLSFSGLVLVPFTAPAQGLISNCPNSNFYQGNFSNWTGCYGSFVNPCQTPGLDTIEDPWARQIIIPGPGTLDPNTCNSILTVFPGEPFSAKLGNSHTGGEAEELKYSVNVTEDSYLFVYRYAVVLQDPGHSKTQQPSFTIAITDTLGNLLDPTCGYYYVSAHIGLPGWGTCSTTQVTYKDWTTVGLNLTPWLGQNVTITFTTRDCSLGGHYGYAYISAYCNYLQMLTALCEGDTSATLTAPPGFSYLWSTITGDTSINGDTTASIVVPNPLTGTSYSCMLTAVNGCTVTITQTLTYTVIHSNFTHDPGCASLPIQFYDSSYVNQNAVTDWHWDFGDGSPPVDGVADPVHTFPASGTYNVTLISYSTEGCHDTIIKAVTIDSLPNVTTNPLRKRICSNTHTNINLSSSVTGTLFTWTATSLAPGITGYADNTDVPSTFIDNVLVNSGTAIDTVYYTVTPHKNTCTGHDTVYKVAVVPAPLLTNNPLSLSVCDSTAFSINLLSNLDSTKFTWTCTASSANLSGYAENTTVPATTISQRIYNSGFTIDTVTYHIMPQAFGCMGTITNFKVIVYPLPDLSNTPLADTICNNIPTFLTLTSHVPGTLFTWTCVPSSGNITGWANNSIPSTVINQDLINSGNAFETVTYRVTPHANGCDGHVFHYVIRVNPTPLLMNTPLHQEQCNNLNTSLSLSSNVAGGLFTWTCTPSSPSVSGYNNSTVPTVSINQVLVNSGYNIETVTYHITPQINGCTWIPSDYIVTVYPTPDLSNNPPDKGICNNDSTRVILTSNVSGTTFTWTCTPGSANISGFSDNAVPTTSLNQKLHIIVNTPEFVTYHITSHSNGCNGPVTDFTVTVNPRPRVTNNPMHDSICSGTNTNIPLTATCTGTTFSWTATLFSGNVTGFSDGSGLLINQNLVNSLPTVGAVLYTIHPVTGPCLGNDTNFFVYVKPTPQLTTAPLASSICSGSPTNVSLSSDVAGTLFTWTCTPSSANVTGFSDNLLTPSVTISQALVNTGFSVETVTYHITPHALGCAGPVSNYVVTVYPVADVYFTPASSSVCSQQATNEQVLSHVAGTTFAWTATASSPNVTGFSGGSGNLIAQTLTNSGSTTEIVTYVVTPTANACTGTPSSVIVTVYPTPHVSNNPLAQTICTQTNATINLASTVVGSTFTWTCTASSPNLSGYLAGGGPLISQTLANSGFTIETVTYHITPAANGCQGPVTNYIVTVNPRPDVSNSPMSAQICSATSPNIGLLSHVTGTTFTWTATGSSPNITGYGPGSGLLINQVLTNLGLSTEFVTYHITPSANGCTGLTVDYVVTIVQDADVYFNPAAQTICSQQTTNIQNLSHVVGTTFTWTASASSPNLSGFSGGAGNVISQTLLNSGTTIETVTYTVSPTAFGCPPGIPQTVVVTVNPTPVITNNAITYQQCNLLTTNIVLQSSVPGTTYTWTCTGSSPNVTGFSAGGAPSIVQTLQNTGFNIETVTYYVTPHANGCPGAVVNFVVTVYPVADLYFTPPAQVLCSGVTSNIGIQSHVAGSAFTWTASGSSPNVSGFSSGSGNTIQQTLVNSSYNIEHVTYATTPVANGCVGTSNSVIITVNPLPVVSLTACWDPMTTTNAQPVKLKGGVPSGGNYSGAGVSAGVFYPGIAGAGPHTITYSYVNGFGCSGTSGQMINVMAPMPFACGNSVTDVRDNKVYPTLQLGTQCWMTTNLDYGNTITSTVVQRDNCVAEKYCINDNPANCGTSGGLYQWDEVMKFDATNGSQGFCPPSWHIPTETEWATLFNFYTSNGFAGNPLKFSGYSGFNAFLYGVRHENVNWDFITFSTMYWSSGSHGSNKAWAHGMNTYNPSVSYYPSLRSNAFSVRCLKD